MEAASAIPLPNRIVALMRGAGSKLRIAEIAAALRMVNNDELRSAVRELVRHYVLVREHHTDGVLRYGVGSRDIRTVHALRIGRPVSASGRPASVQTELRLAKLLDVIGSYPGWVKSGTVIAKATNSLELTRKQYSHLSNVLIERGLIERAGTGGNGRVRLCRPGDEPAPDAPANKSGKVSATMAVAPLANEPDIARYVDASLRANVATKKAAVDKRTAARSKVSSGIDDTDAELMQLRASLHAAQSALDAYYGRMYRSR